MIGVVIGFSSAGLLLLTLGLLIRKGMTQLIAGYDPSLVRDEQGLARWAGSGFMVLGAIALLCGSLMYLLPEEYASIPVIAFVVCIPAGAITLVVGMQRFVK